MVTLAPFIVLIGLTIISIQENHILDTTRTIYHSKPGADYITTRTRGSQAKRFPSTKVLYTLKGTSTFQFKRKLRTCGDIDPIPGPEKRKFKPKYPCGECRRIIRRNQDTILCARCNFCHTQIASNYPNQALITISNIQKEIGSALCVLCLTIMNPS